jgi:uncharacterized membrane protein YvbJ
MITCQACGAQNPADASYCSTCARKLDPETQEAVTQQRAEHVATRIRWSTVLVTAALIVVVILILALFVLHR